MRQGAPAVRCRRDGVWLVAGAVALLICAGPVDADRVPHVERLVFDAINGLPSVVPYVVVWPFMQLGSFPAVPLLAVSAFLADRRRLAASLLLAGTGAYFAAKVVKDMIGRGRPAVFLSDVHFRGDVPTGAGFTSGHAAVATAMATVAWPWLGPRARWLAVAAAAFVCVARVYVGAHFPLDVLGGACVGVLVGAAVRLMLGRPGPCPE